MGKSAGSTTQTQQNNYDPQTADFRNRVYSAAEQAAGNGQGVDSGTQGAIDYFKNLTGQGATGTAALGGDAAATAKLMNPYQQNVIDQVNKQYGIMRNTATQGVNSDATLNHAFGGSRQGVAQGLEMGNLDQQQGSQIAGLNYQGYTDAMGRAGQLANLGFGAAGSLPTLGAYAQQQNDPAQRALGIYGRVNGALPNPTGMTVTGTQQPGRNGASGFLGGAASGAGVGSAFGPWGTAIGGGLGGILGMFS